MVIKMKARVKPSVYIVLSLLLNSCILDDGGIGGTGVKDGDALDDIDRAVERKNVQIVGPIEQFGSIYVNDIRFDVSEAEISVNGQIVSDDDLHLGMIATVKGSVDLQTNEGIATSVSYSSIIRGAIEVVGDVDFDPIENDDSPLPPHDQRIVSILGQELILDRRETYFHDVSNISGPFDFDNLASGDVVEVSGFFMGQGRFFASSLIRQDLGGVLTILGIAETSIESPGEGISVPDNGELVVSPDENQGFFGVGTTTVQFDLEGVTTDLSGFASDLTDGDFVLVNGQVNGELFEATSIFADSFNFNNVLDENDDDGVTLSGFVYDLSEDDFRVNGIVAVLQDTTVVEGELVEGVAVKVSGQFVGGILEADRVVLDATLVSR